MAQNDLKSANAVIKNPIAKNESAQHLFVDAHITIYKKYTHGDQWNSLLVTNDHDDSLYIPMPIFFHLCEQVIGGKKFVQTLQKQRIGNYQNRDINKPEIKIQGNLYFETGYILLEALYSKDGTAAIVSSDDVHKRTYFRIKESILLAYYDVFSNELEAHKRLDKLALARSVNLSECLTL